MKAKRKRFLSSLLVVALLLQMAPFEALAADDVSPPVGVIPADENGNAVEPVDEDPIYATDENGEPIYDEESGKAEDAYIVGEAYDARDEFQKDYRLSDGSFIAVEYGVPVHYEEDGEWQDIDNRLEPIAMYDGTDVYQTVNGDVSQSFSASLADGSIMASSSGDSMLSVSLWDGGSSEEKPAVVDLDTEPDTESDEAESDEPDSTQEAADTENQAEAIAEPTQPENTDAAVADETGLPEDESTDEGTSNFETEPAPEAKPEEKTEEQNQLLPFNRDATAKIAEDDLVSAVATYQSTSEEPRKKTDVIPANLQSTVLYEDVYEGVDLQYDLFSYNIKESIILKAPQENANDSDAASMPYRYCFRLDLANLTPTLQEDGSILMVDEQEQPVYEIPAPFMIDANGEVSDAVTYSLTQLEDSYLLTVEADAQWLEAEERVYPVTIDPTMVSKRNESKFTGATAARYSATSSVSGTQMACGNLVSLIRGGYISGNSTKQKQTYAMGYDGYRNMTNIAVGSRQLASYDYGSQNGNLRSMTYGNGTTVSYTYDVLDRVTDELWNGALKYQYFYNAEGDLAKKLDVTTGKAVNYEYDSLGRLIHSYQTDNGTVQQRTEHLYDSENRLTSQSWQLGSTLYKESFTYSDKDGSLTDVGLVGAAGYHFTYDALKRLSSRYNGVYGQTYTYRTNGDNQTTQIASIDYVRRDSGTGFSNFKLSYEYDAGGNISKITGTTRTDQSASYTYDAQNQLTSETNQNGRL